MKIGSLFAGIGGFDLAARWMGWETAWFSEIDPYASAVLAKHWPGVPNLGDITKIEWQGIPRVDLLCGGFPCQDISNAGKREGISGKRSGLWGEFARAIRELRPRYVVVENVAALLTIDAGRAFATVLGDLAESGYDAEWTLLSAADVGAPHLRSRIWIVAHTNPSGWDGRAGKLWERWRAKPSHSRQDVAHADNQGKPGSAVNDGPGYGLPESPRSDEWWAIEPPVDRVAYGIPNRLDRIAGLGNAVVPQCALEIFKQIEARENEMRVA